MTEYRELHPIGTAERIETLVRANAKLAKRLHRLRGRERSLERIKSLERENEMLKRQIDNLTPDERRARAAKRMWADPKTRSVMLQRQREAYDLRRGFRVPDHLRPEYVMLTRKKLIPAREAGRMLGLI